MSQAAVVSVAGGSTCTLEEARLAEAVGRGLAAAGAVVVCGGGKGVMEAVCRGAFEAGGMTIGLLPGSRREEGNSFLTIAIPTGLGEARNALVARAGRSLIAIGTGYGTLSEIALALRLGRLVIGLHTWSATAADGRPADIVTARTPEEAVSLALREAQS
ncbi:MAG TPA: TIGR00725 family protein [Anaerolineales bacterium]|nr:TIGR00725 family protein [Anaerolineales bacterium]